MNAIVLEIPAKLPVIEPVPSLSFSAADLRRLIQSGRDVASSADLHFVLDRIIHLRGTSITWAFDLPLHALVSWPVRMAEQSRPNMIAPLVIFKIARGRWVPKVVVQCLEEFQVDGEALLGAHLTCRRAGMAFMCITTEHIRRGYVTSKDFKRAFNGAFFCEENQPAPVFCPTLRAAGYYSWPV